MNLIHVYVYIFSLPTLSITLCGLEQLHATVYAQPLQGCPLHLLAMQLTCTTFLDWQWQNDGQY